MSWFFFTSRHKGYDAVPVDDKLLPSHKDEKSFDYSSIFSYDDYKDQKQFKSVFKFEDLPRHQYEADYFKHMSNETGDSMPLGTRILMWIITAASYLLLGLTFPLSYWWCVVTLSEHDRMVIFRLGKMLGARGPGKVVTFPWMDQCKRVDVRASAFSVPPQQFITQDGGIMEMGAEVQFEFTDVETMVREVRDHQDILRSLGRTLITKTLTKKTVQALSKDKRLAAEKIKDDLNQQVRKWGIDIREVSLSDARLLKKPEEKSALAPVLQNLGLKDEQAFPSPEQFVRGDYRQNTSDESDAEALNKLASAVGGMLKTKAEVGGGGGGGLDLNAMASMMSSLGAGSGIQAVQMPQLLPENVMQSGSGATSKSDWHRGLEGIICNDYIQIDSEAYGVYELEILESKLGTELFYIDITANGKSVTKAASKSRRCDVAISLSSSDLAGVLGGTLSPLQAYLTGKITANGDVRKLMFFDKLSNRGHKPGAMFTI